MWKPTKSQEKILEAMRNSDGLLFTFAKLQEELGELQQQVGKLITNELKHPGHFACCSAEKISFAIVDVELLIYQVKAFRFGPADEQYDIKLSEEHARRAGLTTKPLATNHPAFPHGDHTIGTL